MFDYQRSGCSRFGASMGRRSALTLDTGAALLLRKVPIDDQGYDPGGAYWGTPDDLFCASDPETGEVHYIRSPNAETARGWFPRASWIEGPAPGDLVDFIEAYTTAAIFSSTDESTDQGGEPLSDNYTSADLAPATADRFRADCERFYMANVADIGARASDAGHDFYMTRTRSGVGFWETPDWPQEAGKRLTDAAHAFGEVNLYVGDDRKIYQG